MIRERLWRKKRSLKDSRNFKDVFIEHSIPQSQRILNSSLKQIVKAIGGNKLDVKGSVVKFKSDNTTQRREVENRDDQWSSDSDNQSRFNTQPTDNNRGFRYNGRGRGSQNRGRSQHNGYGTRGRKHYRSNADFGMSMDGHRV